MKKNELIVSIVLIAICVLGIVAMMFRSEQIDTKKELSHLKLTKGVIVQK